MAKKVLVIGAVALGPKAASRLRRLNPDAEITLIDEGTFISFGGCGIPYYVSGEVNALDALRATTYGTVRDPAYFAERGITVLNQTRVTAIDRASKTVTCIPVRGDVLDSEARTLPYDKLVLGTGSTPKIPPIPGVDLGNVTTAARLEAAETMRQACAGGTVQRAVIVGGGFIGLEMAVALADMWDVDTSVVEFMDQLLPGVVSPVLGDVARHDLESHGVKVFTSEKVLELEGENGAVRRVRTDKRVLDADLVIFAVGFAPNTSLAKAAGLDVDAATGGILVNDRMQTSDPDIYAGGDCVAVTNLITGKPAVFPLGSLANRQGRVIGTNLANADCNGTGGARFVGALGTWALKLFDMSLCGTGLSPARAASAGFTVRAVNMEQLDRAHFYPEKEMMTLELVVDAPSRRVLGLQGACTAGDALKARIDGAAAMLQFLPKATIDDLANLEAAYAPPFSGALDTINVVANVADNALAGRLNALSPREFADLWADRAHNNVYFADARPAAAAEKAAAEHPGEWHALPLESVSANLDTLPKDRPIALICNTGLRSYEALLKLKKAGLTALSSMGGMQIMSKRGQKF